MSKTWIALFSQTGSEIVNLSNMIGRKPDVIVTNNTTEQKYKFHPGIRELGVVIMSGTHDMLMNYFENQTLHKVEDVVITLHGYLRVLPPHICEKYEIYNGHPGAIDRYPELKGKDPQERVWNDNDNYPIIGSVVHRCTAELDAGEIVKAVHLRNRNYSKEELYDSLKMSSVTAWNFFLKQKGI